MIFPAVQDRFSSVLQCTVACNIYLLEIANTGLFCCFFAVHMKEGLEDLKQICGRLSQLKNEMQTNKKLSDLPEDGTGDEAMWNECLKADNELQQANGTESGWFVSPWLLIECYFYRRIYSAIQLRSLYLIIYHYYIYYKTRTRGTHKRKAKN